MSGFYRTPVTRLPQSVRVANKPPAAAQTEAGAPRGRNARLC